MKKAIISTLLLGLLSGQVQAEIITYSLTQKIESWQGLAIQDTTGKHYVIQNNQILVDPVAVGYMTYNPTDNKVIMSEKVCDKLHTICTPEKINIYDFLGVNDSGGWMLYDNTTLNVINIAIISTNEELIMVDDSAQVFTNVLKWEIIK